jgi:hypothetical protein
MKSQQAQKIPNNSLLNSEDIKTRHIQLPIAPTSTAGKLSIDVPNLSEPVTFKRLLDCLIYALAIDETVNLASALGMAESLNNREALSFWVKNETHGIQFLDASAMFNFLVRQLDNLIFTARRA